MRAPHKHLTYANVIATLAVFLVIGGGTAFAAFIVTSNDDVAPGTISGHKPPAGDHANIIKGSVGGADLADGAVSRAKVADDAINSPKILDGGVGAADLNAAAKGARAYAYVPETLDAARSKHVVAVTNPSDGTYCIELAGSINPNTATLIPSTEFASDNTSAGGDQVAHAEWYEPATNCPGGRLEVFTWLDEQKTQVKNVTGCAGCTVNDTYRDLVLVDQGFSFIVP